MQEIAHLQRGDILIEKRDSMSDIKLAVIYYSMTGNNYKLATWAGEAAIATGAEVKVLKVRELAPKSVVEANHEWKRIAELTKDVEEANLNDLEWADAILFSSPSRFGGIASQLKQFMDTAGGLWAQGKLQNKVVSAMSTAGNLHGGQEQTIMQIYTTMYHWGAIVVSPGYTDPVLFAAGGNPYGTSATIAKTGMIDKEKIQKAVAHQTHRVIEVARKIKGV